MKQPSHIYESSTLYLLGKKYVVWAFRQYYSDFIVLGRENIPIGEPIIFAPNHLNALMDALAVLAIRPFRMVKVFWGRADMFSLPKWIVDFIRYAKILPAYRIRDGYEHLDKNKEAFDTAGEVLLNNAVMCIMPEGNQGTEQKIRPLVKGIFRIAFSAQKMMPPGTPVNIVPIGLDFGDFIKMGHHLIINIGAPIDVREYLELWEENPAIATNQLRSRLKYALEHLTLHIGSDQYYDCHATAIEVGLETTLEAMELSNTAANRFHARKRMALQMASLEHQEPELMPELDAMCKSYKSLLQKVKFQNADLLLTPPTKAGILGQVFRFALASIGFVPGYLANALPFHLPTLLPGLMKIHFSGFFSSIYFGAGLILFPLFYIIQSILLIQLFSLSGWLFIFFPPLFYFSGKIAQKCYRVLRKCIVRFRLYKLQQQQPEMMTELQALREQILRAVTK